jgi:hypothetical protein
VRPEPSQRRWIGAVVAGAGVVAIGFGGVIALVAKSDYDAASCPPRGCSRPAFDARESARSRADVATAAMVVGAIAATAGAVIFFWPSSNTSVVVGANEVRFGVTF